MTALVDSRGCLTPAGMAALEQAPPGQAPPELAQHLAGCARCQGRLLAASAGRGSASAAPAIPPGLVASRRLGRSVAFVIAALLLAVTALALVALLRPGS